MNAPLPFLFAGCLSAVVAAGEAPSPWAGYEARLAPGISRQASKRMSSMTEADWDANDRDRDGLSTLLILALVGLCSLWLPAYRAARMDPVTVLWE